MPCYIEGPPKMIFKIKGEQPWECMRYKSQQFPSLRIDRPSFAMLQGSFREHVLMLNKLPGVTGREVRTKEQLLSVDSLIIPGGTALHTMLCSLFHEKQARCTFEKTGHLRLKCCPPPLCRRKHHYGVDSRKMGLDT